MSVIELARLSSREGEGDVLEIRMRPAVEELKKARGALRVEAYRCLESADSFVFAIEWEDMDAHLSYRETPGFQVYRSHIVDLLAGAPDFAHYRLVAS